MRPEASFRLYQGAIICPSALLIPKEWEVEEDVYMDREMLDAHVFDILEWAHGSGSVDAHMMELNEFKISR